VPQIDTPLLLDILLGLVILLFIPFGIRRGVAKEAMVSAGIFLGASLAARYGSAWGAEISARVDLDAGAATFAASLLLLFAGTFLLGYGGGAALGVTRPGTLSRLVGGLLAAFNAALLLSYLLFWIEMDLQQTTTLDDGILSEALLRRTDVLLLVAAGVLLALTVLGWIVNGMRSRGQPREIESGPLAGVSARQRPVRVATAGDAGKYEPGNEPIARSGRFGPNLDATSPLSTGPAVSGGSPWAGEGTAVSDTNGHGRGAFASGATRYVGGDASGQGDETVWAAWNAPGSRETVSGPDTPSQWPVAASLGVTDDDRCAVCRARVGARDVFCPECGATL